MAGTAMYQLALIVKKANVQQFQFLVTPRQRPVPEKFEGLPYTDRELLDLPVAPLLRADGSNDTINMSVVSEDNDGSLNVACCVRNAIHKLGLDGFNVGDSVSEVERQVLSAGVQLKSWRYWKLVEESYYGPGPALHTLIFLTESESNGTTISGGSQWLDPQATVELLAHLGSNDRRIGPLAAIAVSPHVSEGMITSSVNIHGQEYPPGVVVVPMSSATQKPFNKTNLVIFSGSTVAKKKNFSFEHAAYGEVLIADPGCTGPAHAQLGQIVKSLPRKMLVFLTHHHFDHIEGLPVVRKKNQEAVLLAHEVTFQRMGKATKGFTCIAVEGGSKLLVGCQELEVIAAPGHTDGHLALYDSATGTLVVGDHCVGQGSSLLDPTSGGNLQDYLDTTRRLLELGLHMLVPMHGRPNLWPAHMLNGYIKHREGREMQILRAIEGGARSAFEVVSSAYVDTPTKVWPWALANVKLHVEHLQVNQKLPEDFSTEYFEWSSKTPFALYYYTAVMKNTVHRAWEHLNFTSTYAFIMSLSFAIILGAIAIYWTRRQG